MSAIGLAATSRGDGRNRVTDDLRGNNCDNCGYPKGGRDLVASVTNQIETSESTAIGDKEQDQ
jgi:hypothetical protein